jgi:hypothetical protein
LDLNTIVIIVLLFAVLLLAILIIPRWLLKRAIRQVIRIFRKHNATNAKNAKTIDELGLRPRGFMQGMFRGRDYKPYALSLMMKAKVVRETEDGRFYLSEERLRESGLERDVSRYL